MKKTTKTFQDKSVETLLKEAESLKTEIAGLRLSFRVNPPKDSNSLMKKRKQLAILKTVLAEKYELKKISK